MRGGPRAPENRPSAGRPPFLFRLGQALVDVLLPESGCVICGSPVSEGQRPRFRVSVGEDPDTVRLREELCPACWRDIAGSTSRAPGRPIPFPVRLDLPLNCPRAALLDGVVVAGVYGGALEEAVLRLKRVPDRRLARFLAGLIADRLSAVQAIGPSHPARRAPGPGSRWSAVVPVPLHPSRRRERGFNQAALLGRELGFRLDVPVWEETCERVRATGLQSSLPRAERTLNVAGAFRLRRDRPADQDPAGGRLLIVDDVLTTGATTVDLTRVLKDGGAREVWCAAVARAI